MERQTRPLPNLNDTISSMGVLFDKQGNRVSVDFNEISNDVDIPEFIKYHNAEMRFPEKLMLLITYIERECIRKGENPKKTCLAWTNDGNALIIRNKDGFLHQVPADIFQMGKFTSFTRKLYRWGFRQKLMALGVGAGTNNHKPKKKTNSSSNSAMIFCHRHFQRDNKMLLVNMRSKTAEGMRRSRSSKRDSHKRSSSPRPYILLPPAATASYDGNSTTEQQQRNKPNYGLERTEVEAASREAVLPVIDFSNFGNNTSLLANVVAFGQQQLKMAPAIVANFTPALDTAATDAIASFGMCCPSFASANHIGQQAAPCVGIAPQPLLPPMSSGNCNSPFARQLAVLNATAGGCGGRHQQQCILPPPMSTSYRGVMEAAAAQNRLHPLLNLQNAATAVNWVRPPLPSYNHNDNMAFVREYLNAAAADARGGTVQQQSMKSTNTSTSGPSSLQRRSS